MGAQSTQRSSPGQGGEQTTNSRIQVMAHGSIHQVRRPLAMSGTTHICHQWSSGKDGGRLGEGWGWNEAELGDTDALCIQPPARGLTLLAASWGLA